MLAAAWWGGLALAALVAVTGVLAVREGWRLLSSSVYHPVTVPLHVFAVWAPLSAVLGWPIPYPVSLGVAALAVGVLTLFHAPEAGRDLAVRALFLLVYPLTFLQFLLWIRIQVGATELFYLLALVWAGDTAAYEGGRRTGRRPLAPRLSPNKTVEGAVWALGVSVAVAVLAIAVWPGTRPAVWYIVAAVVVWFLCVGGDLFESLLKRAAGRKDSGQLLSAHGGVLDRFDSLLWAGAGLYALCLWHP
jgi:phosphatidate cytidylyltransferase